MFWLIKRVRRLMGHDRYSSETIDRLAYSMHVEDLRLVASVTMLGAIVLIGTTIWMYKKIPELPEGLAPFQITAILAGFGGILAWCYKTGSARLGFVDVFACEIATLCRICTINDFVKTSIKTYEGDTGDHSQRELNEVKENRE